MPLVTPSNVTQYGNAITTNIIRNKIDWLSFTSYVSLQNEILIDLFGNCFLRFRGPLRFASSSRDYFMCKDLAENRHFLFLFYPEQSSPGSSFERLEIGNTVLCIITNVRWKVRLLPRI